MKRTTLLLLAWPAFLPLACSPGSADRIPAAPPAADETVLAEVDGKAILAREVDKRAAARLLPLRQDIYDLRREVLDELIGERLFEKEAAARGLTVEALLKAEVEDKVPPPDSAVMLQLYQRSRFPQMGQSFDQVRPQIEAALREQARNERQAAYRRELASAGGVRRLLRPPRVELTIPASAPSLGPKDAPVTIVEYADYECPYCQRAQETIDQLLERYPGKVRLVHRDFPLDFHSRAKVAARASYCAGEQDRFWEFHRSILATPGRLADEDLKRAAAALKLDDGAFSTCLASERYEAQIQESLDEGLELGVSSTPTFFINGRLVKGARSLDHFVEIVEDELAAAG